MDSRIQERLISSLLERVGQKTPPPVKQNLEKLQAILELMLNHLSNFEKEAKSLRNLLDFFENKFGNVVSVGLDVYLEGTPPDEYDEYVEEYFSSFGSGEAKLLREIDAILISLRRRGKPQLGQFEDYTSRIVGDLADILKRYDQVVSKEMGGKRRR